MTCAGVLVLPGDVLVGDAEGVVVVPAQLADEVARDAVVQELVEQFALECVNTGESARSVYTHCRQSAAPSSTRGWRPGNRGRNTG